MSGYVFHCTPCGYAHAGECPPKAKVKVDWEPYRVEVTVGSHWKCEGLLLLRGVGPGWTPVGPALGFEVMAIISNGDIENTAVQLREWGQPLQPVVTVLGKLWFEHGFDDGCGYMKRMVAWT